MSELHPKSLTFGVQSYTSGIDSISTPYFINAETIVVQQFIFKFCAVKIKYNCSICVIINSKHLLEVNREAKKMFSNSGN